MLLISNYGRGSEVGTLKYFKRPSRLRSCHPCLGFRTVVMALFLAFRLRILNDWCDSVVGSSALDFKTTVEVRRLAFPPRLLELISPGPRKGKGSFMHSVLAVSGPQFPCVRCDAGATRDSIMNAIGLSDHPTLPHTTPLLVRVTIRNKWHTRAQAKYESNVSIQNHQSPRVQGRGTRKW